MESTIGLNMKYYGRTDNGIARLSSDQLSTHKMETDHLAKAVFYVGGAAVDRDFQISASLQNYLVKSPVAINPLDLKIGYNVDDIPELQPLVAPLITVIHNDGFTPQLINTFQEGQPLNKQYLAANIVLANKKHSAINPFDIKVGLNAPMPREKQAISDFLIRLFTPAEASAPYNGIKDLVAALVDKVYSIMLGDDATEPRMYDCFASLKLNNIVTRLSIIGDYEDPKTISFQQISHRLHQVSHRLNQVGAKEDESDFIREMAWRGRNIAHRLAMPLLKDLQKILITDYISVVYQHTTNPDTGESLTQFASRVIQDAAQDFPCFTHPTADKLDLTNTRVVAIDLQDVDSAHDHRHNSLFLRAATMLGTSNMNFSMADVIAADMHDSYRDFYKAVLKKVESVEKVVVIEAANYYKSDERLMMDLLVDIRERRKLGINMVFSGNNLSDFQINDSANSPLAHADELYVFSEFNGDDINSLHQFFYGHPSMIEDVKNMPDYAFMAFIRYDGSVIRTRHHMNLLAAQRSSSDNL